MNARANHRRRQRRVERAITHALLHLNDRPPEGIACTAEGISFVANTDTGEVENVPADTNPGWLFASHRAVGVFPGLTTPPDILAWAAEAAQMIVDGGRLAGNRIYVRACCPHVRTQQASLYGWTEKLAGLFVEYPTGWLAWVWYPTDQEVLVVDPCEAFGANTARHGDVADETLMFECPRCSKLHLCYSGTVCPCGEPFPAAWRAVNDR